MLLLGDGAEQRRGVRREGSSSSCPLPLSTFDIMREAYGDSCGVCPLMLTMELSPSPLPSLFTIVMEGKERTDNRGYPRVIIGEHRLLL